MISFNTQMNDLVYMQEANTQNQPENQPGPETIKFFSSPTQLSMKFFLLKDVKMPTIVGIFTFMSEKNRILGLFEPKKPYS